MKHTYDTLSMEKFAGLETKAPSVVVCNLSVAGVNLLQSEVTNSLFISQ